MATDNDFDLDGRSFLVTGANSGIGRATAIALARRGARVTVACRSSERAAAVLEEAAALPGPGAAVFLPLDLAELASVRRSADEFLSRDEPLHVLINNAGVAGQRGLTADGFELAFGVNHLGHFLLTTLLLDRLRQSVPARVVTVSSVGHRSARGVDFDAVRRPSRSFSGLPEYGVSKLCNLLFTQELARREAGTGLTTYALHPGTIASDIWRRVPWPLEPVLKRLMRSTEEGAQTSLYCATAPELAEVSGRYYDHSREKAPSTVATPELGAELWARSEEFVSA
ncbi:MAG TPA: SDR family oxidoreductase [Acidimicrobiales bacterium]|nr:SDR family oxidoreductase [Acidimicrobiales bacterium]